MNIKNINYASIPSVIILSLVVKLLYVCFAVLMSRYVTELYVGFDFDSIIFAFKRNDAWWYEKIVTGWYPVVHSVEDLGGCVDATPSNQSVWAFFPLYPAFLRLLGDLFSLNFDRAAFVVSLVFSLLGFVGFYVLAKIVLKDAKIAMFGTAVFILMPFHLFFSMFYTEAIFLSLVVWSFVLVNRRFYLLLPLMLALLAVLRPNGLFVAIPLYLYYLEQNDILNNFSVKWKELFKHHIWHSILFLSGSASFAAYCWFQYSMTGYWNAFSLAQAGWCREYSFPLLNLFDSLQPTLIFNSIYTLSAMLFAVFLYRKIPLSFSVFVWINILLPMVTSVLSMPRLISVVFPLWIMVGYYLYPMKYKWGLYLLLTCAHMAMFYLWMKSSFFCI